MKHIIFDFDSTLIRKESLELILAPILKNSPEKITQIEQITDLGMQGELNFRESLEQRLAIASPTRQSIKEFTNIYCPELLTNGIKELIKLIKEKGYQIWIFSGGLTESIEPFAECLAIPKQNVLAVDIIWNDDGSFKSLDNTNGACDSKLSAFTKLKHIINGEVIAVGDGYTDYQLFEAGFASKFVAYIEHIKREKVVSLSKDLARNSNELKELIV